MSLIETARGQGARIADSATQPTEIPEQCAECDRKDGATPIKTQQTCAVIPRGPRQTSS